MRDCRTAAFSVDPTLIGAEQRRFSTARGGMLTFFRAGTGAGAAWAGRGRLTASADRSCNSDAIVSLTAQIQWVSRIPTGRY